MSYLEHSWEVLNLCKEAVGIFYSPSRLGKKLNQAIYLISFWKFEKSQPLLGYRAGYSENWLKLEAIYSEKKLMQNPDKQNIYFLNSAAQVECDTRSIILAEFNKFEFRVFLLLDQLP